MGWQSYYRAFLDESSGAALIDHRGPYVGDGSQQGRLIDAIASGGRTFLISAPPGCGKSRFALELARRIGREQRSWEVRFVRHEPCSPEELSDLKAEHRILVVDDAHECPSLVEQLASLCSSAGADQSQVHLVCLTLPSGHAGLIQALTSHFAEGEPLELDLGRPNPKLVRELIDKLIPQLSPHHRDVIRRFVPDSFFVAVLLCSSVARQRSLPQTLSTKNLRDYAIRQPVSHAVRDLCPADKAFRALAVYVACAPVRSGDTTIRASAAAHAGLSVSDVETLEQRVLESGLFQLDGLEEIRPVPSLVGDLILEESCLDEQGGLTPFGRSLIGTLLEQGRYEPVMRNCSDIARLFSTRVSVGFLAELLLERASALAPSELFALLDSCSHLARGQPATIVRLVEALTEKGVLRASPPARELGQPGNPEMRARSLLSLAGECDPAFVPRALEYSRRLFACALPDPESCRVVRDSLAASCQFAVARPLAHAAATLEVLKKWTEAPDADTAELATSLVQGFLRLEMYVEQDNAPTSASVSLNPAGEVLKLRDRAVDILIRCASNATPAVQYAAADSLRWWAHGYERLPQEQRERWRPQLGKELDALAETFSKLGSTSPHLPVRAAVERQGLRWWTEGGDPLVGGGGKRIIAALPPAGAYSLWKALYDPTLPVCAIPLDESIEAQHRREHVLAVIVPAAEPTADLTRELFDQLDPLFNNSAAWSAAFTSVLSALPKHSLQPRARLYLAEFVRRHPAESWSLISEEAAQGPLGTILPELLVELRKQDAPRWHEEIQRSLPGTRLFEVELRALCAVGQLDSVEREVVSKGLELDDAQVIHLSAQALLSVARSELDAGLAAVFAVLPARPTDERLWALALDAFARWGDHALLGTEAEEAGPQLRAISGELLRLLRTYRSALSWAEGVHTERVATVAAIFAVAIPHTLKSWLRELWAPAVDQSESGAPLSAARMVELARLIAKSPTASYWHKQFVEWMTEEPNLAIPGARCLAELSGLADPCVIPLVARIARQPARFSLDALGEFLRCRDSPELVDEALALLGNFLDAPEAYALLEAEVIATLAGSHSNIARSGAAVRRPATLDAIDRCTHKGGLHPSLVETLARAREAVQAAIEEDLLRGDMR